MQECSRRTGSGMALVRNLLILFVMLFSFFCHMQGRSTGNMFLLLDEKDNTRSKKKHDDERR